MFKMNSDILHSMNMAQRQLAILVDPEKWNADSRLCNSIAEAVCPPDYIFVGGSTAGGDIKACIQDIRRCTSLPIVLFPGTTSQFTSSADAILFLSVLSSDDPEYLVKRHIRAARVVSSSDIEVIPMGYIIIDGGCPTSVSCSTHSVPIPQTDIAHIVDVAIAAQLLGKALIYLEAGSGAMTPVSLDIIRSVKNAVSVPLIVGGGICTVQQMLDAYNSGADIVVIGNHFERCPNEIPLFCDARR